MADEAQIAARPTDRFWPLCDTKELAPQILSRFREYIQGLQRRKLLDLMCRTSDVFYGYDPQTGAISDWVTESGEDGEFLNLHVNEVASLIRHQVILTTSDQLELNARATNDDPESEAQASLGDAILAQARKEGTEDKLVQACSRMLRQGTGYIVQTWDAKRGADSGVEDVGPDGAVMTTVPEEPSEAISSSAGGIVEALEAATAPAMNAPAPPSGMQAPPESEPASPAPQPSYQQQVAKTGDVVERVYGPLDVAIDLGARTHSEVSWYVVLERWNRWDAIACWPEHREELLARPTYACDEYFKDLHQRSTTELAKEQTDGIHIARLIVKKCEALPAGMEAVSCGSILLTPPLALAYKSGPVHPMIAEEIDDLPLGYSINWNLLGPQAALNAAVANGLTTLDAGSIPKWAIPKGADTQVEDLGPNARALFYNVQPQAPEAGRPVLMDTPTITPAHFEAENVARARMERLSGVNSVVRGQSEGKSGADNALLDSKAVQYMNLYSRAYANTAKSVAMGRIEILQVFATRERVLDIVGEDEAPSLEYFTGSDLHSIRSVEVELGDPIMRTMQGRKAVATELLERFPQFITPEQYLSFIATGRLEPLYKAQRNQVRLVRGENAKLSKGERQPVLLTDCHALHVQEHLALLSAPSIRADETITGVILAHVAEHVMLWQQVAMANPALLAATGQQPPPPPMGGMAPGMPGAPPPGAPPGGPSSGPSDAPGSGPNGAPSMPSMPKNPQTGEQAPQPPKPS